MIYFINLLVVFIILLLYKGFTKKRILKHYIKNNEPVIVIFWSDNSTIEYGKTGDNFYVLPNWEKCNDKLNKKLLILYEDN